MAFKSVSYIDKFNRDRKSYFSPSGSKFFDQYEYQTIEGIQILVKVAPIDRQAEIDSYAASCDISNILNRFMNGETTLLNAAGDGTYADIYDAPTTFAEYFNRVKQAKSIFNDLPVEVKEKFDNDPEKFFTSFGTDEFKSIISTLSEKDGNQTSGSASVSSAEVSNESEVGNAE